MIDYPALVPYLGQAIGVPSTVSAAPPLPSGAPGVVHGILSNTIHRGQSLMGVLEILEWPRGGGEEAPQSGRADLQHAG